MRLRISTSLFDEMEPAIGDAVKIKAGNTPDPSDPVYLKLHAATWGKTGIVVDAAPDEARELIARAECKIEVAQENMSDDPPFWRGRLAAWRALSIQIKAAQAGFVV